MFKKREKPKTGQGNRKRDEDDGESSQVQADIAALKEPEKKKAKTAAFGESITSTTKKGEQGAASTLSRKLETMGNVTSTESAATIMPFKQSSAGDATRTIEMETDFAHDTRAILERNEQIHKDLKEGKIEAGVYRGLGAYKRYLDRSEGAISNSKYSGLLGPTRTMTQVRMTMNVEYWGQSGQGGICKDFKECGYCGFGDACKFLHDRSDYKSGWQLDREWEEQQKEKEKKLKAKLERKLRRKTGIEGADSEDEGEDSEANNSDSSSDDDVPSVCQICRTPWLDVTSNPVVTQCQHYFCETCALEQYVQDSKCAVCMAQTNGIFNAAENVMEKANAKKKAKEEAKKKRAEEEWTTAGGRGPQNHGKATADGLGNVRTMGNNLDEHAGELEAELTKDLGSVEWRAYRSGRRDGNVGSV
eukprot:gnl/MRDRNA2_/MRDRNA2_88665_c0_seq1.p1 gnl/MRDRNA2_/MRDRNA2_88665_c0~~gnl/MRDRNA2_/MRDRNA2_88665_c0_seq1.p1  ORF type:complete len:418 (+),score=116.82 gnl/MRDRNA2_/MRDRNA2_88665_c0_seq1:85-1338(+)